MYNSTNLGFITFDIHRCTLCMYVCLEYGTSKKKKVYYELSYYIWIKWNNFCTQ